MRSANTLRVVSAEPLVGCSAQSVDHSGALAGKHAAALLDPPAYRASIRGDPPRANEWPAGRGKPTIRIDLRSIEYQSFSMYKKI